MIMFRSVSLTARFASLLILLLAVPLTAQSRRGGGERVRSGPGTGNPEQQAPAWRFVEKGEAAPIAAPLILYWLPASLNDMNHSALLTSRALLEDSVRCVAVEVIVPGNGAMVEKLGAAGRLPTAVIVDRHGNVIRRAENTGGVLRSTVVEQMVREELSARDEAMYQDITQAKRRADAGDKQAAIDLYRRIWDDRCLFPLAGNEAQSALKALGVVVQETPATQTVDPYLAVSPPAGTKAKGGSAGRPPSSPP